MSETGGYFLPLTVSFKRRIIDLLKIIELWEKYKAKIMIPDTMLYSFCLMDMGAVLFLLIYFVSY
jgi:hypothetical protein